LTGFEGEKEEKHATTKTEKTGHNDKTHKTLKNKSFKTRKFEMDSRCKINTVKALKALQ